MEIQLPSFNIEAVTDQCLYRGVFQPRGELFTYINDRRFLTFTFIETAFHPLQKNYRVNAIKQAAINVNWQKIIYMAMLNQDDLERVQLLQSERPVTFYTFNLAIRGNLRVNLDAHENDLLDETRDFLAVTDASILPLRPLAVTPAKRVPLITLNRRQIESYHVYQPKDQ